MEHLNISVIIAVSDDILIKECVDSVDEDVEIVIALNGATYEVEKIVKSLKNVRYVELPERNIGKANNLAISAATNQRLIFMDSDCVFTPGSIRKLYFGLDDYKIAKGRVLFKHKNFETRLVAKTREVNTTTELTAFKPCLAIRKDLINDVGYIFDDDIHFREDYDLTCRVFAKKIPIKFVPEASVYHTPLPVYYDLRSSFRYGCGHRIGIKEGVLKGSLLWGGDKSITNSLLLDAKRIFYCPRYLLKIKRTKGVLVSLYSIIWMASFTLGYYCQEMFKVFKVEAKKLYRPCKNV
ncbi:MAG: glycosyltransferase family A protein [Patescibacteria group bacterium]|nr:glycosyltransferase family A protein [Patescibacteria group bacterium]MDD5121559.1 glycosyltransferase family A protein [Patescibacteria group bacterium]MDD5222053.1 glycosyltransferase family A protein [Patescibacteria group bacterium]MDD5396277.1 glycosyltransferase family A protein [Patescibacteria group bacterium]